MQFRTVATVAVALLVALSGCSALGGSFADGPSNETETESNVSEDLNDSASVDGEDEDDDANETDEGTESDEDDTADKEWYPPAEPNRPLEDKREDRIESVEFVDTEPAADGEGYSNFNLEVVANTSMENVDPPEHGDVVGEPYFFVKINEDTQKIVERTREVRMDENGTFHIDVRPAGIEEFGEGPLTVEVFLMDEDKDWDDIYASVGKEIYFNPDTDDADEDTDDTDESTDDTDADSGTDDSNADEDTDGTGDDTDEETDTEDSDSEAGDSGGDES
ncbi:hypothetical protein ACFO5R_12470 [Halosolutus amylolyticus]|uniref:Uncharacterized protein n=1 Tax=Halosolutus amylolyticus TaxID=2932267 RepID=A0ABD5PQ39_9EURY|nr:hypothetical protein [Halosolutus amylolyticus]